MGIVSDYLRDLIARQVDEKGLVVWFDPDNAYPAFAHTLALPNTTVACYDGSFFALRHQIDPLLDGEQAPRLVVYIPLAEEQIHDALVELTASGCVLKPGQNPWQRNTRLSVVATHALRGKRADADLAAIAKQVDAGQLTLRDLDDIAQQGGIPGVLSVIFGTGDPEEIGLAWLASDERDSAVVERGATGELARMLDQTFGIDLPAEESLPELRARLARHVLSTEFIASLRGAPPAQLVTVRVATDGPARTACVRLVRTWRLRRDLGDRYAPFADRTEQELGLAGMSFDLDQLRDCETFAAIERALQSAIEVAMRAHPAEDLLALGRTRQSGYWASRLPEGQPRWALIVTAGELLRMATRVEAALRPAGLTARDMLLGYTEAAADDAPWCVLDTLHRELERLWSAFDADAEHAALEQLIGHARDRYTESASQLAERFVDALAQARFQVAGTSLQRDTYATVVAPRLREGKTAYLLIDALRFEMARELVRSLGETYQVQLSVALGTVPTVTPIGMAALMPGAERSAQVVPQPGGKLALHIGEALLKDRRGRVEWLLAHAGLAASGQPTRVAEVTLETLLRPTAATRKELDEADLVFVTSQEIDQICESDNILLARGALDGILTNLQRAITRLAGLGCKTIVFTADHGFVFAGELTPDSKIDPPGGETLLLHRRVWLGHGGASSPAYLRAPLSAFGLSDDPTLEIAVPKGLAGFKAQGGARAYFHGGMSPQEIAIPVAVLTPLTAMQPQAAGDIEWALALGSRKISTRFCSVRVGGQFTGLFAVALPHIRAEVRLDRTVLSVPVTASYGFMEATGDVQMALAADDERTLQENTVTLSIAENAPTTGTVSIHLLDAVTGRELKRLDGVEMAISI